MADQQIEDLGSLTTPAAGDQFVVNDISDTTDDVNGSPKNITFAAMGGLENATGSDADTAMAVGTAYVVDMSSWATSVRTYSLPSTAAVGDRIAILISSGNATHELAIRTTAASNDTINGVDHDSSDFTKLFTTGEVMIFRCVTANSAWVVEYDGRIACKAAMGITTSVTTNSAGADTKLSLDNQLYDFGGIADPTTNNRFDIRRDGVYYIKASLRPNATVSDRSYVTVRIKQTGSLIALSQTRQSVGTATAAVDFESSIAVECSDGDYIEFFFITQDANDGVTNNAATTYMSVLEIL